MEDGGVLELYDVSRVDEDLPEVTSPFDCDWESLEVLVRKLVLDRRRRSLKKGIVDDTDRRSRRPCSWRVNHSGGSADVTSGRHHEGA